MKPHIIVKLDKAIPERLSYWEDIIENKQIAKSNFTPEIDQLFSRYKIDFWATENYQPQFFNWNIEEVNSGLNRVYRLILKSSRKIPSTLISEINHLSNVEKVTPGMVAQIGIPRGISTQQSLSQRYPKIGLDLDIVHQITDGSEQIKIAVLDTGFSIGHRELEHAVMPGKDFVDIIDGTTKFIGDFLDMDDMPEDEVGHGTHVAGIIAGKGLEMPIGVAPKCKIIPVKVLGALKEGNNIVGAGLIDNINTGIKWAVDVAKADIINMSLGIKHEGGGLPHKEIIEYALRKGVSFVAASGNDGKDDKYYPGALPGVIAVGAVDSTNNLASFSSFGAHVSIVAPGTDIYSSYLNNSYAILSGTSQAAPFVSGAIGLLKSLAYQFGKNLTDKHIKYILRNSTDRFGQTIKNSHSGYGSLNILDALKLLQYKINPRKYA